MNYCFLMMSTWDFPINEKWTTKWEVVSFAPDRVNIYPTSYVTCQINLMVTNNHISYMTRQCVSTFCS